MNINNGRSREGIYFLQILLSDLVAIISSCFFCIIILWLTFLSTYIVV